MVCANPPPPFGFFFVVVVFKWTYFVPEQVEGVLIAGKDRMIKVGGLRMLTNTWVSMKYC